MRRRGATRACRRVAKALEGGSRVNLWWVRENAEYMTDACLRRAACARHLYSSAGAVNWVAAVCTPMGDSAGRDAMSLVRQRCGPDDSVTNRGRTVRPPEMTAKGVSPDRGASGSRSRHVSYVPRRERGRALMTFMLDRRWQQD